MPDDNSEVFSSVSSSVGGGGKPEEGPQLGSEVVNTPLNKFVELEQHAQSEAVTVDNCREKVSVSMYNKTPESRTSKILRQAKQLESRPGGCGDLDINDTIPGLASSKHLGCIHGFNNGDGHTATLMPASSPNQLGRMARFPRRWADITRNPASVAGPLNHPPVPTTKQTPLRNVPLDMATPQRSSRWLPIFFPTFRDQLSKTHDTRTDRVHLGLVQRVDVFVVKLASTEFPEDF